MAEGEINIDNIIQRLLEGENLSENFAFQALMWLNLWDFKALANIKFEVIGIESDTWWAKSSGLVFFSPREQTWQDGADDWGWGERALSQVQGAVPPAAHPARAGGSLENMWWVDIWDFQDSSELRNVMAVYVYNIEHMCDCRENGLIPLLIHLMFINRLVSMFTSRQS